MTITIDSGPTRRVSAYDLAANTWTMKGEAPMASRPGRVAYDPVSGRVVVQVFPDPVGTDPPELWTYDVGTDSWTPIRAAGASAVGPSDAGLLNYDASVDRVIAYNPEQGNGGLAGIWLFDLRTGTWSRSRVATPPLNFGWFPTGGEIAYDEASERTLIFSDGEVIAYDAAADRWQILDSGLHPGQSADFGAIGEIGIGPTSRLSHSTVYDPVNRRLVVYGGSYRTSDPSRMWVQADDVLAFDPVTRAWTTLLKASRVQPAPS